MTLPRILVTGATGKTGRATVASLLERDDVQVRALVRRDDERAHALREAGAEVVIGDMGDLRDLRRALSNVQRAYFLAPVGNHSLDYALNFAIAAEETGLEHVVVLSQWLASPSHGSVLTRRTWLIDRLLSWIPGVEHTVINVGWFADNYMPMLGMAAQLGVFPLASGAGTSPPISNEDIGRVVAGVLANPKPYAGRTLRPTGPASLSAPQIADAFATVLGRPVRHVDASDQMLNKTLSVLQDDRFAQVQILHYMRDYRQGAFGMGGPTDVVQEVTGQPAEDFVTIARRYAAADPMAKRTLGNTLTVLFNGVRIALTSPLDTQRWARENGLPSLARTEDCVDATEWTASHATPQAFSVHGPDAPVSLPAPRLASV
jgi:NAD(P)H dehydrogenase (quinone)